MITVTENQLRAIDFLATSPLQAVQMVRTKITQDDVHVVGHKGVELINRLLGTNLTTSDLIGETKIDPALHEDFELMTTQAVAETVLKNVGTPIDEVLTVQSAKDRAMRLINSPQHRWMFAKPQSTADAGEQKAVVEGVDVKVAVKADGKIKKGGKETLAIALYQKYVAELNGAAYDNQTFIAILVKELGMSKAGATTYNYNMKKKFGGKIDAKPKK